MQPPIHTSEPWALEEAEVGTILGTSREGLSDTEALRRLDSYGANKFSRREKKGPVVLLFRQFASPLIFILVGAGAVTFFLREWAETVVIALAVFVNALLGFFREYHAENTLERLTTYIKDRARVMRGGREQEIDSELLVPGDVIKLSYGARVPADARIVAVNGARLDEAVLTGESVPVEKGIAVLPIGTLVAERTNIAHAGTLVVDGFATAIVVETGERTEIGKIAGLVVGIGRAATPIQRAIGTLSWIIFALVVVIVFGIFMLGVADGQPLFEMLVLSAAVAVGAVPEAMPIALTVILSIGAERIAKKNGVTRTLAAAETLGSATLILTDKTGTLTKADMELVGAYDTAELAHGAPSGAVGSKKSELISLALNNVDIFVENPSAPVAEWTWKGRPFEVNIAKNAREAGIDVSSLATRVSPIVIPFNSTNKFSVAKSGDGYIVMGAPDILLARSVMEKDAYVRIEEWIAAASRDGNRLIALASYRKPTELSAASEVQELVFLGILAFHDPIRAEVPEAVRRIESLGVRVVMVTGDLKGTALAVARAIGWEVKEDAALSGEELRALSDDELTAMLPRLRVFARVTPEDKLRIGTLYRKTGEVVAMTGDGVNDAPALKAMDIGVALGSGSDVAKSAADLVLLDDNFETVTAAITEGRRILGNIRKTLVYLMANSLDEVFVVGGSLLLALPLPLTALQIIWVNLCTGSLTALAFAYDENFDHDQSGKGSRSIFTRAVKTQIFGIGLVSSLLLFGIYVGLLRFGVPFATAQAVFFVCFASYISVVAFSFRSLHKPLFSYPVFSNRRLNISVIVSTALLIVTMTVGPIRDFFGLAPMPAVWLWFVAAWLLVNVGIVEVAKLGFHVFRKSH